MQELTELQRQGMSIQGISKLTGWDRKTVPAQPSRPYVPKPLITDPVSTTAPPSVAAPTFAGSRPSKAQQNFFSSDPVTVAESF